MPEASLFIGGSIDGERMVVQLTQVIRIPEKSKHGTEWIGIGTDPYPEPKHEDYRLIRLGGNATVFNVYALDGMTADNVVERLIAGYSAPPAYNPEKCRPLEPNEVIRYGDRYKDGSLAGVTHNRNGIGDQFRNGYDSDMWRPTE